MIDEIDRTLERWFRAELPLPAGEGDVTFDQPEKSWDARRSTPMVNSFLYSVNKSVSRAMSGTRVVQREDGGLSRELLVPIVEARYLVSVWGGGPGVEHELLGRVVNLLSSTQSLPEQHQGEALLSVSPRAMVSVEPDEVTSLTHLWSGLGVPPRPAVQLLVYSPMGLGLPVAVPDPPRSVGIGMSRPGATAAFAPRRRVVGSRATVGIKPTVAIQDSGRDGPQVIGGNGD